MPNRILREGILTSPRIAKLGWAEEVFYRRLMSVVDDYGRYYGDAGMLRAACYPRQLNKVSDPDVDKWTRNLAEAGLVRAYAVNGEAYVELLDFRQQARAKVSKFPEPTDECVADARHVHSTRVADAPVFGDVSVFEDGGGGGRRAQARATTRTRLAKDWELPAAWGDWAANERSWSADEVLRVSLVFRDHWVGKGEARADWEATWRNWVRNQWVKGGAKEDARAKVNNAIWGKDERAAERVIDGEAKRVA